MQSHRCLNVCVETLGVWAEGKEGLTELRKKPLFCQMFLPVGKEGGANGLRKRKASATYMNLQKFSRNRVGKAMYTNC